MPQSHAVIRKAPATVSSPEPLYPFETETEIETGSLLCSPEYPIASDFQETLTLKAPIPVQEPILQHSLKSDFHAVIRRAPPTVSSPEPLCPFETEIEIETGSLLCPLYPTSSDISPNLILKMPNLTVKVPISVQAQILQRSECLKRPLRPGPGTIGERCSVITNHVLVRVNESPKIFRYDVSITPEVTSRCTRRKLLNHFLLLNGGSVVFDGDKSLFSTRHCLLDNSIIDPDAASIYCITTKYAGSTEMCHLLEYLQDNQMAVPQKMIHILDVVLKHGHMDSDTILGTPFFSRHFEKNHVGGGLECWRAFRQSLCLSQMGLSLNIDVTSTTFLAQVPVVDFVKRSLNLKYPRMPLSDVVHVKVEKALRGLEVMTIDQHKKRYIITGITSKPTRELMSFADDADGSMSLVQYFEGVQRIKIKYAHWPALQVGSDTKPIYLPMEVCKVVRKQSPSKKLNKSQAAAILKQTCQNPPHRQQTIEYILSMNIPFYVKYAPHFGIIVEPTLTTVQDARVLPSPMLIYHDKDGEVSRVQPCLGQWNMRDAKMVKGGLVHYWAFVNFSSLSREVATCFRKELVKTCIDKGVFFNQTPVIYDNSAKSTEIETTLTKLHAQSVRRLDRIKKRLQIVIIILPDSPGTYGTIKRICETKLGMISQCCKPQLARNNKPQHLRNMALKINVKVGGRNNMLFEAFRSELPLVADAPTIIFGAHVTHPPPGEDSCPSIAGVVASMDWPEMTKYRGMVSAQPRNKEIIDDLFKVIQDPERGPINAGMILKLLIQFLKSTGYKPQRIIFYRHGVSEGKLSQVLLHELDAIRKACISFEEEYQPPVTFVVVQKRHHTRLFPFDYLNKNLMDRSSNILPGTVVDSMICHPSEFDFYLCSHAGTQGTSRPRHYHVLWDENKFTSDQLQTLTNNLCYTYARCTRSVSVVPPVYYARLAALRGRHYVKDDIPRSGSGTAEDGGTTKRDATIQPLPQMKGNVKKFMFYC